MAFDLRKFVPRVDTDVFQQFIDVHGRREKIDWQKDATAIAADIEAALAMNAWAYCAMEHADLIASSGGRELLRSAGHHRSSLMPGVDNPDWTDETCAIWLAVQDGTLFDHIVSAAYAMKGLGTRSWEAFKVDCKAPLSVAVDDADKMEQFRENVRDFLRDQRSVPAFRNLVVDHYRHRTSRTDTHSLRSWIQVNVFADQSPETREALTSPDTVGPVQIPRTYRASILCDPNKKTIEVVAIGGRPVRDGLVELFRQHLLPADVSAERLVSRRINFDLFRQEPSFEVRSDDEVSDVVVDEVRLLPPSSEAGLITLERKRVHGRPVSVYQSAAAWFGGQSPIGRPGWNFMGVRLRLTFKPDRGHRARIRTIELRSPRGTSLREKTDADHAVAEKLLRRWGVFLAEDESDDD